MSTVTMRHPGLPADQVITVMAIAVAHHQAAGWQVVDDKPAPETTFTVLEAPPIAEDDISTPVAPKRRRTQKEDDR